MLGLSSCNAMRWARRAVVCVPLTLAALIPACNRADEFESCVDTPDAGASSAARVGRCPTSIFLKVDQSYRDISGRVWAGENGVEAAIHVEGTDGFGSTKSFAPLDVMTDTVGNYATIRNVPFAYDLTASFGSQLLTIRGLGGRFFEPTLDDPFPAHVKGGPFSLDPPLMRVFSSHVDLLLAEPLPAGKSLAFFTLGDTVEPVSGDLATGITIASTTFTAPTTLYVFAYDTGSDLSSATAYGKVAITVTSGGSTLATVTLADLVATDLPTPTVNITGPAGYAFSSLDVIAVYSRLSRAYIGSLRPGVAQKVPLFHDSLYTAYRLLLKAADGATIDSGVIGFAIYDPATAIAMETILPPVVAAPESGATVALTDPFVVSGAGVYEHTFAPQGTGSGPTIHVLTASGDTHLPAFSGNSTVPHGAYTWTVRAFPKSTQVTGVSGRDSRRGQPSATSAPRTIVFP